MNDDLLTVAQTAIYLQVSEKTILRLIKDRTLIASKVARSWRIKSSDIEAYLKSNANNKINNRSENNG